MADPKTILAGQDPYGKLGGPGWMQRLISGDVAGMPDYLIKQLQQTSDENGTTRFVLGSAGDQQLYDRSGQPVQQLGNDGSWYGNGDGSVKDWSKAWYDPDLGLVTSPDNTKSVTAASYKNFQTIGQLLAAAATAGAATGVLGGAAAGTGATVTGGMGAELGGAAGAGAGVAGTAGAGLQTLNTGLSSLFQGAPGMAPGVAGSEAEWLAGAGVGGGAGAGAGAGGFNFPSMENLVQPTAIDTTMPAMTQYTGQPWYQSLIQSALANPQGTARLGLGAYSLISSLAGQHPGSALVGNSGSNGPDGSSGTAAMFTPDLQSQFQMNPYLLRPVPFMSRG